MNAILTISTGNYTSIVAHRTLGNLDFPTIYTDWRPWNDESKLVWHIASSVLNMAQQIANNLRISIPYRLCTNKTDFAKRGLSVLTKCRATIT